MLVIAQVVVIGVAWAVATVRYLRGGGSWWLVVVIGLPVLYFFVQAMYYSARVIARDRRWLRSHAEGAAKAE
jgi:uncharacterized membrane protein